MNENEVVGKITDSIYSDIQDCVNNWNEWDWIKNSKKAALRILRIAGKEMAFWKSHPPDADYEAMITEELWQAIELAREAEDVDKT